LLNVVRIVAKLSLVMFRAVLLWKPSVPELPDVPAAVSAEPEYRIP
jgi:hypothetical protein